MFAIIANDTIEAFCASQDVAKLWAPKGAVVAPVTAPPHQLAFIQERIAVLGLCEWVFTVDASQLPPALQ